MKQDFSWVKAEFACSPFEVFKILRHQCEQDVLDRNTLHRQGDPASFKVTSVGDTFLVLREGREISSSVKFEWNAEGITVRDNDDVVLLRATPTVNERGECKLRVGEEELTFWQFRKKALLDLFSNYPR